MVTTSPTVTTLGLSFMCLLRAHADTICPMGFASSALMSSGSSRSFGGKDSSNSEGELAVDMYAHSPGDLRLGVVDDDYVPLPLLRSVAAPYRALVLFGDGAALFAGPLDLHYFFSSRFLRSSSIHSSLPMPGWRIVRPILLSLGLRSLILRETILALTASPSLSPRFVSLPRSLLPSTSMSILSSMIWLIWSRPSSGPNLQK